MARVQAVHEKGGEAVVYQQAGARRCLSCGDRREQRGGAAARETTKRVRAGGDANGCGDDGGGDDGCGEYGERGGGRGGARVGEDGGRGARDGGMRRCWCARDAAAGVGMEAPLFYSLS